MLIVYIYTMHGIQAALLLLLVIVITSVAVSRRGKSNPGKTIITCSGSWWIVCQSYIFTRHVCYMMRSTLYCTQHLHPAIKMKYGNQQLVCEICIIIMWCIIIRQCCM